MTTPSIQNTTKFFFSLLLIMLTFSGCVKAQPALNRSIAQKEIDVCIIGGGIAGLTAAYDLTKRGKSVIVLEKSDRLGGRIKTKHWANGQYSEIGAEDIIDNEADLNGLIKEFSLKLKENKGEADGFYFEHTIFADPDPEKNLNHIFSNRSERKAYDNLVKTVSKKIGHLKFPLGKTQAKLDLISGENWVWEITKGFDSDRLIRFLNLRLGAELGGTIDQTSALYVSQSLFDQFEGSWFHIEGGNELLITKLAEKLIGKTQLHSRVDEVKFTDGKYQILYKDENEQRSLVASKVIITVPSFAFQSIKFEPEISKEKRAALARVKWGPYITAHLQFAERIWNTKYKFPSWNISTDGPLATIVDSTYGQPGAEGVLSIFLIGDAANKYAKIDEDHFFKDVLSELEKIWPGIRDAYIPGSGIKNNWPHALPIFSPNYIHDVQSELAKPEGKIFFAGDYTEQPGLDGAVHSGHRAVTQLLKTP
ncbi:MAG: hypothetical protein JWQ35_1584 [Bacteriovoracaceae bacterium]|nr:hypothetical protein [Bacteriovoracaceae bacterium]